MNQPSDQIVQRWLSNILSVETTQHDRTEQALCRLYEMAGKQAPTFFLWHASPLEALWSFAVLAEEHDVLTKMSLQSVRQNSTTLAKLKQVRSNIQGRVGAANWVDVLRLVGTWQSANTGMPSGNAGELLPAKLKIAQVTFLMKAGGPDGYKQRFSQMDAKFELLQAMERQIFGHHGDGALAYGALSAGAAALRQWMGHTFYRDYSYLDMARDAHFCEVHNAAPPALLEACWELASLAGIWWPFEHAVVLSERPVAVERDAQGAVNLIFSDGWRAHPYEPKVSRTKSAPKVKPAKLLSVELPRDHSARIAFLRSQARQLPLYERYVNGRREETWKELIDLGTAALADDRAADALAVAYETMERAKQNIQILLRRLRAIGYVFADVPHIPPDRKTWKSIQKLNKAVGSMPLSLRAFYDVVGAVNFMGKHQALDPVGATFASDPLVVYGADEALEELDGWEPDEDEQMRIVLAPDDLHKANVSGGDPYAIFVPAHAADAKVESEPNAVNFVEYLRLVFAWGGFPGWKNGDAILPAEIKELRDGLLPI
jgi:hypothetical protein